jgi:capsular polysaccharide biosynthesis protein
MEEISLREIIENLIKNKWLIIAIVIVALLITGIGSYFISNSSMQVNAIISINTDEIKEGDNPDGSRFNTNAIISPSIINKAVEGIDLGVNTVDDIRKNISISPIIPSFVDKLKEAAEKNGEEYEYFPSEFKIVFSFSGLFSDKDAKKIVDNIIDFYHEDFIERYSTVDTIENLIAGSDYDRYDYKELSDLIEKQLTNTEDYLNNKQTTSNNYRSKKLGYSYYDLLQTMDIIKINDFAALESIIEKFNLSKNANNLIRLYEFQIKELELNMKKKDAEAKSTINLMQNFDQKKSVVMVPGIDNKEFKADSMISYYDKLAERAATASVQTSNTSLDIAYIQNLIDSLKNDEVKKEYKEELEKDSEAVIKTINTKLDSLIVKTNKLSKEYRDYIMDNAVTLTSTSQIKVNMNIKMNLAIALVLGLMLGAFIAFFKEYWKNSNQDVVKIYKGTESKIED